MDALVRSNIVDSTANSCAPPTSAPGLGPPLPHLHRALPHLSRDLAHPLPLCHICTGTRGSCAERSVAWLRAQAPLRKNVFQYAAAICHIAPGLAIDSVAARHIAPGLAIDSIAARHIAPGLAIDSVAARHIAPGLARCRYRLVYQPSVVPRLMRLVFWFEWSAPASSTPGVPASAPGVPWTRSTASSARRGPVRLGPSSTPSSPREYPLVRSARPRGRTSARQAHPAAAAPFRPFRC
jgi:hypothetical protein